MSTYKKNGSYTQSTLSSLFFQKKNTDYSDLSFPNETMVHHIEGISLSYCKYTFSLQFTSENTNEIVTEMQGSCVVTSICFEDIKNQGTERWGQSQ